ncbi:MAG: hypothetical protein AABW58_02835 [Nanoarchaeota archaeon]
MLPGLLFLLFRKRPRVEILTIDEKCVDFAVEDRGKISLTSVPKTELVNSELAQLYARNGTRVVDIALSEIDTEEPSGFIIYLDNGIKYYKGQAKA